MAEKTVSNMFLKELKAEATATRRCLENIKDVTSEYKPHEKSMAMNYLTLLVAEVPSWIATMVEGSEIDFATFKHEKPTTNEEMLAFFDKNMEAAVKALENTDDEKLQEMFYLKNNGHVLMSSTKEVNVGSSLNHWVHHRGQLTVYMRLNNIAVPSIYGPSADENTFK